MTFLNCYILDCLLKVQLRCRYLTFEVSVEGVEQFSFRDSRFLLHFQKVSGQTIALP